MKAEYGGFNLFMTIIIDIDGTIAVPVEPYANGKYPQCETIEDAVESVNELFDAGHTIIFHTARPKIDCYITAKWLQKHGFKYHKLVMDKPLGDIYVDDKGFKFKNWKEAMKQLLN
jgi:uncharacterized HAD superfamily protein